MQHGRNVSIVAYKCPHNVVLGLKAMLNLYVEVIVRTAPFSLEAGHAVGAVGVEADDEGLAEEDGGFAVAAVGGATDWVA